VHEQAISCVLNVQHACAEAGSPVTCSKPRIIEQTVTSSGLPMTSHKEDNMYILNSASLYSPTVHRELAGISITEVSLEEWKAGIAKGLNVW
ncbi:hypothetical protein DFH28DRAFT_868509, partial [Melampsora americana]